MQVFKVTQEGEINITPIISSLTLQGEYRSCCRTIDFSIIKSETDLNTYTIPLNLGEHIKVIEQDVLLFYGLIWDRSKQTDSTTISIHCKDFGIYLNKNKCSYIFKNLSPVAITQKICRDYGIEIGELANISTPISRNFINTTLYQAIISSYNLASDKKFMCIFRGSKLHVIEKGKEECKGSIESGYNLLTSSVSESLNSMVNKVNIYNEENKLIECIKNNYNLNKYGSLTEYHKVDKNEDYQKEAQKRLKGIEQKIAITNFGDVQYVTGKKVTVIEPYNGLKGIFYIDGDTHIWKNNIYSNKLTLNFENIADESEGGTNERK